MSRVHADFSQAVAAPKGTDVNKEIRARRAFIAEARRLVSGFKSMHQEAQDLIAEFKVNDRAADAAIKRARAVRNSIQVK